jgi:hypothetical protein
MNGGKLATWFTTVAAIVALIAMQGEGAIRVLTGVPAMLQAWSAGLPFGVWSFTLSTLIAAGAWSVAIYTLGPANDGRRPHFAAIFVTLVMAIAVTMTQQYFKHYSPGEMLTAFWLGLLAGFVGSFIALGIKSAMTPKACPVPPEPKA